MYLLIKPASGACNLRCNYCFYADEMRSRTIPARPFMSAELFRTIIEKAVAHLQATRDNTLSIGFQGGEPTLAGLPFFRSAVEAVRALAPRSVRVSFFLQTNGIAVDDEFAAFFAQNRFLIGLSLDGPSEIHNLHRLDPEGSGTQKTVLRAAAILKKHNCEFNILTVVTKECARHPQQIYRFFQKQGFTYQQYIPCIAPLDGTEMPYALTAEEYGSFLCRIFDLWYNDVAAGKQVYHREFENYVGILLGRPPEECGMVGCCSLQYLIESDGLVYPCDFYALDDHLLGDLKTDDFKGIDEKRKEMRFIERSYILPDECRKCEYVSLCRGGCYRNRDESGKNRFCAAYRTFFPYALPRMLDLAKRLARR